MEPTYETHAPGSAARDNSHYVPFLQLVKNQLMLNFLMLVNFLVVQFQLIGRISQQRLFANTAIMLVYGSDL